MASIISGNVVSARILIITRQLPTKLNISIMK